MGSFSFVRAWHVCLSTIKYGRSCSKSWANISVDFSFGFWVFSQIVSVSVIVPTCKVFLTFLHAYFISDISLKMKVAPKKVIETTTTTFGFVQIHLFYNLHRTSSLFIGWILVPSSAVLTAATVALALLRATTFLHLLAYFKIILWNCDEILKRVWTKFDFHW